MKNDELPIGVIVYRLNEDARKEVCVPYHICTDWWSYCLLSLT